MKKVFISTSEHFLIAADSITKIEVVNDVGRYKLLIETTDGSVHFFGGYETEEIAWQEALAFLDGFAQVVSFD